MTETPYQQLLQDYAEQFGLGLTMRDNGHVTLLSPNRELRFEYYPTSKKRTMYIPHLEQRRTQVTPEKASLIAAGEMQ